MLYYYTKHERVFVNWTIVKLRRSFLSSIYIYIYVWLDTRTIRRVFAISDQSRARGNVWSRLRDAMCCNQRPRVREKKREIGTGCYIRWLERKGNYFEFSAFEWKAHPIDYYRIEQTRSAWSRPFRHPRRRNSSRVVSVLYRVIIAVREF